MSCFSLIPNRCKCLKGHRVIYGLNNGSTVLPDCGWFYCVLVVNDDAYSSGSGLCSLVTLWMPPHLLVKAAHSPIADSALLSEQLAHIFVMCMCGYNTMNVCDTVYVWEKAKH